MNAPGTPLPENLSTRPFRVHEALVEGISRGQLERSALARPHHGVRSPYTPTAERRFPRIIAAERARDYLPLLRPGELFSHTTVLFLLGAPLEVDSAPHVTVEMPNAAARGKRVCGHRTRLKLTSSVIAGYPCVTPLKAITQAAPLLPPRELVVALDHLLREGSFGAGADPILSREQIWQVAQTGGFAGAARLRRAIALSREGAESRMETLTRLLVVEAGFPYLELQADVHEPTGEWIGRFDLRLSGLLKLIEYDGQQHRTDQQQYARDQERIRRATAAGFEVLRLTAVDLQPRNRGATLDRIRRFAEVAPTRLPLGTSRFLEAG